MKKLFGLKTIEKLLIMIGSAICTALVNQFDSQNVLLQLLASVWSLLSFVLFVSLVPGICRWLSKHVWPFTLIRRSYERNLKTKDRVTAFVYVLLRVLTILAGIQQLMEGEYFNAFLTVFTLILFTLPQLLSRTLKVHLPDLLEIIVYCFIFAAEILGEINNFYNLVPFWDTMLHTMNGFLCAAIGFSLVDLLNRNSKNLKLSPLYVSIVAFCFSMTVGVLWEFFEFTGDRLMDTDMQKDTWVHQIASVDLNPSGLNKAVVVDGIESADLHLKDGSVYTLEKGYLDIGLYDTMDDLFVNFIGAIVFSTFGYFYVKDRDKDSFVTRLIPTVEKETEEKKVLHLY